LGVGLILTYAIEAIFDWAEKKGGIDPQTTIAGGVEDALENMRVMFVDGEPRAKEAYAELRKLEKGKGSEEARKQFRDAADSIEKSGILGVHFELNRLHEARKKLRREALHRLIIGDEGRT
jgi:hypothetical protein